VQPVAVLALLCLDSFGHISLSKHLQSSTVYPAAFTVSANAADAANINNLTRTPPRLALPQYRALLQWFSDHPGPQCPYSLHNMCQAGLRYDKLPGEWYGPSAAACVLRDLAAVHEEAAGLSLSSFGAIGESPTPLRVHVAQGGTVYTSEVDKLACTVSSSSSTSSSSVSAGNGSGVKGSSSEHSSNGNGQQQQQQQQQQQRQQQHSQSNGAAAAAAVTVAAAVDPLSDPLRCPPKPPPPWQCSVLLLVPLRLGLDGLIRYYYVIHTSSIRNSTILPVNVPPYSWLAMFGSVVLCVVLTAKAHCVVCFVCVCHREYIPSLLHMLRMPQSLGFIGGRPNHAMYFIGAEDQLLCCLDPHTTQVRCNH
jgi:Peptidase family C54